MSRLLLCLMTAAAACHGQTSEITYDSDKYGPGEFECSPVYDIAMTFRGTIVDEGTNAPLADAKIALHDDAENADPLGEATSAEDGTFSIEATGLVAWDGCLASAPTDYQLHISHADRSTLFDVNQLFGMTWSNDGSEAIISDPIALP